MKYDMSRCLKIAGYTASAAFLGATVLRDIERDQMLQKLSYDIDRIEGDVRYLAEKRREEDPDIPWVGEDEEAE